MSCMPLVLNNLYWALWEHSGSVGDAIDWGLKAPWFEAHHLKSHCIVSLSKTLYPLLSTVKPVLSGHSKNIQNKEIMTNASIIKVESIAECSPWSILQYFWPALSNNWSWKPILVLFESGFCRQVLLYWFYPGRQEIIHDMTEKSLTGTKGSK